jgi:hypothetical protein
MEAIVIITVVSDMKMFDEVPKSDDIGHSVRVKPNLTWVTREITL